MGSAVSAPIRQQAKALKGRRYMRGMLPEKYFEVVVKKEHGELLDILGFSEEEAFQIFVQACTHVHGHVDVGTIFAAAVHRNLNDLCKNSSIDDVWFLRGKV